ncbi:MAG: hypothetical protein J2P37_00025 [Ktedonobacteraceae bacterium]|nr:hypothetical protein [Ktedonobacteraceae bacterium]
MTNSRSSPLEEKEQVPPSQPASSSPRVSIFIVLALSGALLIVFTGLLFGDLPQALSKQAGTQQPSATAQAQNGPLSGLTRVEPDQLLPADRALLYEKANKLYVVPTDGSKSKQLALPGYGYDQSAPPLLLPSGQLLYSGDGIWLADLAHNTQQQLAQLPKGEVITSMVASSDGSMLAWSSAPANGQGMIRLFAGPLHAGKQVYEQQAGHCPCFRAFAFLDAAGKDANRTLLLTDDRGDHRSVRFGLWRLDLAASSTGKPELLMKNEQQGPLALLARSNLLLYSDNEGVVPSPTDHSVPDEIATLSYANSLAMTTIQAGSGSFLDKPADILSEQDMRSNIASVRWVTTPMFSPDGHTLAYIAFSSDDYDPFDRHSALYTTQFSAADQPLRAGKSQLLATATTHFIELGPWLNDHQLTFYSDGSLYTVDTSTGKVAAITSTGGAYTRIVGVVDRSIMDSEQESGQP